MGGGKTKGGLVSMNGWRMASGELGEGERMIVTAPKPCRGNKALRLCSTS